MSYTSPAIRLVAVDLDGTLLNDAKQVTVPTAHAIRALVERGVKVVIASARPPRSVRPIYHQLRLDTLQINYNGALIWDESAQKVFFHRPIETDCVQEMIRAARDLFEEVLVTCEILDRWYTDRVDHSFLTETARLFPPDVIAPIESFHHLPTTKLMLQGQAEIIRQLELQLADAFSECCCFVRQEDELLQITDRHTSKSAALRKVAQHYNISPREMMAIGDAPNDMGMIQLAGVGVAMGNGWASVKDAANWVAPTNQEDGVLAALHQYGLI